jgi:hypothetical protein
MGDRDESVFGFCGIVMAGLDPAIPLRKAKPRHIIGIAGSSPAMTRVCPYHPNML